MHTIKNQSSSLAEQVAQKRLDLVVSQINGKLEHQSVDLHARTEVKPPRVDRTVVPKKGLSESKSSRRNSNLTAATAQNGRRAR